MAIITFIYNMEVEKGLMSQQGDVGRFILDKTREVEAEAKRNLSNRMVNVQTGRLRSSTGSSFEDGNKGPVGVVYSTAEYAAHVHAKRPYLTAALEHVARTIR